jgi:hypothetical protein
VKRERSSSGASASAFLMAIAAFSGFFSIRNTLPRTRQQARGLGLALDGGHEQFFARGHSRAFSALSIGLPW